MCGFAKLVDSIELKLKLIDFVEFSFIRFYPLFSILFQFGALTPLEPRLGKKLIEPLTNLIHRQVDPFARFEYFRIPFVPATFDIWNESNLNFGNHFHCSTSAMSLLYECINTVIAVLISISSGMPNHTASIQLCVQKLRILIEDSDQNRKSPFCIH